MRRIMGVLHRRLRPWMLLAVAGMGAAPGTAHAQFVWTPQTNNPEWSHAQTIQQGGLLYCVNNWNDGIVQVPNCPPLPTMATGVLIPAGSLVNIASNAVCAELATGPGVQLTLQGGALTCTSTSLASPFYWSGGSISNSPSFDIGEVGAELITNSDKSISASIVRTSGTTSWGGGNIFVSSGSRIENSGAWNVATNSTLLFVGGAGVLFDNTGAFLKTAGTGTTSVSMPFRNANQVRAFSGTLRFTGDLTSDAGSFTTQPGTAIEIAGTATLNTGTTLQGAGLTRITGFAGVTDLVLADTTALAGGTIAVTPDADFRVIFSMNWSGGRLGPLGQPGGLVEVISPASMDLSGTSDKSIDGVVLRNDGLVTWGGGNIFTSAGAVFENRGRVSIESGNTVLYVGGATTALVNSGILTKTSGGATTVNLPFVTSGLVHALGGDLTVVTPTSSGPWVAETGRTVLFNGTATMNGGTTLRGGGTYRLTGSMRVNDTIPVDTLVMDSGSVFGPGELRVDGSMTWNAGRLGGDGGRARIPAGVPLALSTASDKSVDAFTLLNEGTCAWSGGNIFSANGAIIENAGTWECRTDNTLLFVGGTPTQFRNSGTFRKTASPGVTVVNMPFSSSGLVSVESGTLRFGNTSSSSSMLRAEAGTAIEFTASPFALEAGSALRGEGTHRVTGGLLNVNAAVPVEQLAHNGGTISVNSAGILGVERRLDWSGSAVSGSPTGILDVAPGATAELGGTSDKSLNVITLRNRGIMRWAGGNFFLSSGALVENSGAMDLAVDATMLSTGGAPCRFVNTGELMKSAGGGVTVVSVESTNAGTVRALTGTLRFNAPFVQSAGAVVVGPGTVGATTPMSFAGGEITGAGVLGASVNNTGAAVRPGVWPGAAGVISMTGAYSQSGDGAYEVDVVSAGAEGADRLEIGAGATLGGVLRVSTPANGMTIPAGTFWTILGASMRQGTFDRTELPRGYRIEYTPTGVVLRYSCPGDFSEDGAVNSQDFFGFLTAFFSQSSTADFNGDGAVTSQDFFDFLGAFFAGCV